MNERVKIFMKSASQMGVGKPELEALTKLFKVCLESALEMDDEENWEYATDTPEFDLSEKGVYSKDIDEPSLDEFGDSPDDMVDTASYRDRWNRRDEFEDDDFEQQASEPIEAKLGTKLADAYIQIAPKIIGNQCSADEIDNLSKFIDWLIKTYKKFNPKEYMKKVEDQYNSKKSYDTDRMDKILDVVNFGSRVVQLLTEIKNTFSDELTNATFTNEASVFPVAKDINAFMAEKFNTGSDNLASEQADQSIIYDDSGFRDVDAEEEKANPNKEKALTDEEIRQINNAAKKNTQDTSPDTFSPDEEIDTVENAVIDFVNFVPTISLSDSEVADFNKPVKKETKKKLKTAADKRGEVSKMYNGDVVDSNSWKKADEDDLWADL